MDKLLREENIIVSCLSKYECLKWEQIIRLLYNKTEEVAQRIIIGLKKKQIILEDEGGYLMLDPRSSADDKKLAAFWVLLNFIETLRPEEHYPANYPSEIFFLRNGTQYEIAVLNPGEEHLINMLFMENRNNSAEEEDITKYILVVPTANHIDDCVSRIPEKHRDNVLFATVAYANAEADYPDVEFYKA